MIKLFRSWSRDKKIKNDLSKLLAQAISFGLIPQRDNLPEDKTLTIIEEYIDEMEFGLAFDQLLYELHDQAILITHEYFQEITQLANRMEIQLESFQYVQVLINR